MSAPHDRSREMIETISNGRVIDPDDKCQVINIGGLSVEPSEIVGSSTANGSGDNYDEDSDIISVYIGHYGKWQFLWTFLLCLFQIPSTFHIFAFVFQSVQKEFWCARPEHLRSVPIADWINFTKSDNPCAILDLDYDRITANDIALGLINTDGVDYAHCTNFEYDNELIGKTIVAEWGLVCEHASFVSVVEMCFLAGAAFGAVCSGWLSDLFGRRHTLMVFASCQAVIGTLAAYVNSLELYMALRVLSGFTSMAVIVVSFVLVVELVSGKWRIIVGILNILPVAITYIITAFIAFVARDWRTIQLIISLPEFLLIFIWFRLPESPRWLLINGRTKELEKVIQRACTFNEIRLPSNFAKTLEPPNEEANDQSSTVTLFDLVRKGYRMKTILMMVIWFTLILLYFGITLHMSNLGGNIYTNNAVAGSVEAIAICLSILVVLKLGIRINLIIYMLVAGMACLAVNFVPDNNLGIIITLAMIGKCSIGASNAIIPIFTAYQYPTYMRNLGVGIGNFAAGAALIIVPYLWLMEHIQIYLPMTVMGVAGIIGAVALILLDDSLARKSDSTSEKKQTSTATIGGVHNKGFIQNEHL